MAATLSSGRIGPELELMIHRLEQWAARSRAPEETATVFNRAGDAFIQAGEIGRGLVYYGRSINTYLGAGQWEAAHAVCSKLIRIYPPAVRARSTLAWISIRSRHRTDVERYVEDYVEAAIRAAQEPTASLHLRYMADATLASEIREGIAMHLISLGEHRMAESLLERVYGDRNGLGEPHSPEDAEHYWNIALRTLVIRDDERHRIL